MNTPVVFYEDNDQLVTGFYVPKKYDKTNVPTPTSKAVFINELKESLYAVIRFRGAWNKDHFLKKEQALKDYLKANGYTIQSKRYLFRYQPPFVPGPFRRNEIVFQVEKS